jgi:hypothetical protein
MVASRKPVRKRAALPPLPPVTFQQRASVFEPELIAAQMLAEIIANRIDWLINFPDEAFSLSSKLRRSRIIDGLAWLSRAEGCLREAPAPTPSRK